MESGQNVLRKLPEANSDRKQYPITTGVVDYFPLALAEVARVSKAGNDHHNPGQPLHWARGKSTDHSDCIARHLIQRGEIDIDGQRHSAKLAWRALALLQEELEAAAGFVPAVKSNQEPAKVEAVLIEDIDAPPDPRANPLFNAYKFPANPPNLKPVAFDQPIAGDHETTLNETKNESVGERLLRVCGLK